MTGHEKNLIRNSTAEFLIFTSTAGEESIEVRYEDETIWLSQKMMAALFDVSVPTINFHLKKIYESGELTRNATVRKFLTVQTEGNRRPESRMIIFTPRRQTICARTSGI